ncbi:MAG: amino acid racemase [Promicromonosporaceae bacterium]|nr:amino acid racemase [Promicromonosporaceae bacterium]
MKPLADRPLIGVIGGVGPLATAYFLRRVIESTAAQVDQDHLDLLVFNHAAIPDRTRHLLDRSQPDPGPVLAADARRLEGFGCDFLVMPCNTAHTYTQQVQDAVTVPFVSIIDVTVAAARARLPGLRQVGLLATAGTVAAGVYDDAFAPDVVVLTPSAVDQQRVDRLITQVKAGVHVGRQEVDSVAASLRERGAELVLLGCTELSVIAVDQGLLAEPTYLDTLDCLVRATIKRAGAQVRG